MPATPWRRGGAWCGALLLLWPGLAAAEGASLPSPVALALARGGLVADASAGTLPSGDDEAASAPAGAAAPEAPAGGGTATAAAPGMAPPADALRKVRLSRALGVGGVMAWGLVQWDYGERSLHGGSEGWFGRNTPEGGADKAGHLYTGYVVARGLAALYRGWGLGAGAAARQGALSSLLLTTAMELGDGFSPYGVSGEDMVMNLAGAGAGLWLAGDEAWRERVDLRVEYRFHPGATDLVTDYGHARYLLALKPAGFRPWRASPLRWLELQAGYYARGYGEPQGARRRTAYAGLGLNLPLLLRQAGQDRVATFLQFYQPPDSSLRLEDDL